MARVTKYSCDCCGNEIKPEGDSTTISHATLNFRKYDPEGSRIVAKLNHICDDCFNKLKGAIQSVLKK